MLLIVAGAHDADAHAAAVRLGPQQATLLDATDLSRPGWRLDGGDPRSGVIVAGGKPIAASAIGAVLVRRLAVYPQELRHVHEQDRSYVANEMTALLAWWLHALPVPVLNRPRGTALCGPGWRTEQWRACANRLGFPVVRQRREITQPNYLPPAATELTMIGKWINGKATPLTAECLMALACAAEVDLLCAAFDATGALITAHSMPSLSSALLDAATQFFATQMEPPTLETPPRANLLGTELLCGGRA